MSFFVLLEEDPELGDFFAELNEIQVPEEESVVIGPTFPKNQPSREQSSEKEESVLNSHFPHAVSVVYSKAPELHDENKTNGSHPVYTYDQPEYFQTPVELDIDYSRYYYDDSKSSNPAGVTSAFSSSYSNSRPQPPPPPLPQPQIPRSDKSYVRKAADEVWVDETLQEWPENDFRIFVGDIGKEITTEALTRHFQQYKSFAKAKVVRGKDGKPKGYGFVSFLEPGDCIKAMKEENGRYLGSRPMKIRRSTWKDRDIEEVHKKEQKKRKLNEAFGLV